jgi:poly-gamma-glutamate synthesis protein (capsule biosynthesis protein)
MIFIACYSFSSCSKKKIEEPIVVEEPTNEDKGELALAPSDEPLPTGSLEAVSDEVTAIMDEDGMTLETRFRTPKGFTRLPSSPEELTGFLRGLSLKEAGSDVLLYDGLPKAGQDAHAAVFAFDVGDRDLQQCADSVMRVYAEYYWSVGAYDKIAFHLTNGFLMEYPMWRDGSRLVVDGNDTRWSKTAAYDDSYENFRKYLNMVYAYAGTLSLSGECAPAALDEILPGDMFLQGGSPGHCVLVVDIAEDQEGNRCFLLAQGYMPAQDFHVLKNPLHPEDPWYYASEISYPLRTPLWSFEEGSLVRWDNFLLNAAGTSLADIKNTAASRPGGGDSAPAISDEVITSPEGPSSSVSLLAVGDNLIHIQVVESGEQTDGSLNYDHLYSNIADEISAADIAVVNQETILGGDEFGYFGYPSFNSPTEIGDALIDTGFDVVLQATNHTMDMGLAGVENTIDYWKQHPRITTLGINETKEESEKITVLEKNGIKLALLNYTYGLNGYSLPDGMPWLVNLLDKKKMTEDIEKAEALADFTVVFPHWGTEYVYEATKYQKDLTDFFYERGVDLVIGSHPHVLEPVEWIEKEDGHRMLVYYSLGNFMSYQKEAPRMLGGIAKVTITRDKSGTYISKADIIPIVTHFENGPADYNYAIYKLTDYNEELASRHGVSELAMQGPITYQDTLALAKQILGLWFQ